jgi:hypothetical protein
VNKQTKRKPTKREKAESTGLDRILRQRKPRGGFVVLAKYSRLKSVAA